jgi:hypothetical protein
VRRLAPSAALALLAASCADPTAGGRHARGVRLSFALARGVAFQGPYVSVLDSIAVTVTDADGRATALGVRLGRRDTSATFAVEVPEGTTRFDALVLSATRAVLFGGSRTLDVSADDFVVRIQTTAQAPVLLVAPDTLHVPTPTRLSTSGTVGVYNRGVGPLLVRFRGPAPLPSNGCAPVVCLVPSGTPTPLVADSVVVPAGAAVAVTVAAIQASHLPLTMTFASAQGSVPLVVVTP